MEDDEHPTFGSKFRLRNEAQMVQETINSWFTNAPDSSICLDGGISLVTAVGCVRETNQDRVGVLRVSSSSRSFTCACLCDGMGGMRDGDLAAANGISAFFSEMIRSRRFHPLDRLEYSLQFANQCVAEKNPGAGSTLSAILIESPGVYIANVGDSRIFGFTSKGDLVRLTVDDTMRERYGSENSGLLQHLGLKKYLKPHVQKVAAEFESFMLASDGCYTIGEDSIVALRKSASNSLTFANRSVELSKWFGGHDNSSLIYIPSLQENLRPNESRSDVSIFSTQGRMKIEWIHEEAPRLLRELKPINSDANDAPVQKTTPKNSNVGEKKQSRPRKPRAASKESENQKQSNLLKRSPEEGNQQFSIGFDDEEKDK